MGAHKHNPTAIAAKNGELPPKLPKKSKREMEQELYAEILSAMMRKSPATLAVVAALNGNMPSGL